MHSLSHGFVVIIIIVDAVFVVMKCDVYYEWNEHNNRHNNRHGFQWIIDINQTHIWNGMEWLQKVRSTWKLIGFSMNQLKFILKIIIMIFLQNNKKKSFLEWKKSFFIWNHNLLMSRQSQSDVSMGINGSHRHAKRDFSIYAHTLVK